MRISLRIRHHIAPQSLARRSRLQIRVSAKRQVQHTSFPRAHGRKAIRLPGTFHALRGGFRRQFQLTRAQSLEILRVKRDSVVLLILQTQHFGRHVFQSAQQLSSALRQQAGIRSGKLDVDLPRFEACRIGRPRARSDAEFQAQSTQTSERFQQICDLLCCLGVVVDGH